MSVGTAGGSYTDLHTGGREYPGNGTSLLKTQSLAPSDIFPPGQLFNSSQTAAKRRPVNQKQKILGTHN